MFLENNINQKNQLGWIEVICGSMFSGKTEELIRRLKRVEFANQKAIIFKPVTDMRYSKNKVVSHDSNEIESIPVKSSTEIMETLSSLDNVMISPTLILTDVFDVRILLILIHPS